MGRWVELDCFFPDGAAYAVEFSRAAEAIDLEKLGYLSRIDTDGLDFHGTKTAGLDGQGEAGGRGEHDAFSGKANLGLVNCKLNGVARGGFQVEAVFALDTLGDRDALIGEPRLIAVYPDEGFRLHA